MLRHVKQRLLLVIEMAGHHQRAGVRASPSRFLAKSKPPATASVAEVSTTVSILSNSRSSSDRGNIDGRGLQEGAAAAPLDPVDVSPRRPLPERTQAAAQFARAAQQRNDLLGRVL